VRSTAIQQGEVNSSCPAPRLGACPCALDQGPTCQVHYGNPARHIQHKHTPPTRGNVCSTACTRPWEGGMVDHLTLSCVRVHTADINNNHNTHTHTLNEPRNKLRVHSATLSNSHVLSTLLHGPECNTHCHRPQPRTVPVRSQQTCPGHQQQQTANMTPWQQSFNRGSLAPRQPPCFLKPPAPLLLFPPAAACAAVGSANGCTHSVLST
jgi:hypothetical protein